MLNNPLTTNGHSAWHNKRDRQKRLAVAREVKMIQDVLLGIMQMVNASSFTRKILDAIELFGLKGLPSMKKLRDAGLLSPRKSKSTSTRIYLSKI
jgi:hypothetical protein